jgi:hypothetical protein
MLTDLNIINQLSKNEKIITVGSISTPTVDGSNIQLPVIVITQNIIGNFDERDEVLFENNLLKMMQHVVLESNIITISNRETALINTILTPGQLQFLLPIWAEQQMLCIEYRLSTGKSKDDLEYLFSVGGLWDNISKSWVFEPHSKAQQFWQIIVL